MIALENLLKRVKDLNVNKVVSKSVDKSIKNFIIELNTEGQPTSQLFNLHIDSTGKAIFSKFRGVGVYSRETERRSGGRKKAGDQYTLKDTGDFYESFKVNSEKIAIVIVANPIKEDTNLTNEYGPDILGLTKANTKLLIDALLPKIKNTVLKQIQA